MHVGSLESMREVYELLEVQPRATLASQVLSKLPKCIHNAMEAQSAKSEPILLWRINLETVINKL